MPSYKDDQTGKWYCKFYYQTYTGERKQKCKRGFDLKREADQWERDFLERVQGSPDMTFSALADLYLEHIKTNTKPITYRTKESRVRMWLLPYFSNKPINSISSLDVKQWQDWLKTSKTVHDKPLSPGYIGVLHRELSTSLNFAVKYYDLPKNPCPIAGNVKGSRKRSLNFWTLQQFESFIDTFDQSDPFRVAFLLLYWSGMRVGELQALTIEDIDSQQNSIRVNKTFHLIHGEPITHEPKSPAGNRTIKINASLMAELQQHIARLYDPEPSDRIFTMTPSGYGKHLDEHAKKANLPKIRVHDLRHSHASLLINEGYTPTLIASRLGHEKVSMTLDIYGHLYPDQQGKVADRLEELYKK